MEQLIIQLKSLLSGHWQGEGFAKFPTIDDTAYTEQLEFAPDPYKPAIFFHQKSWFNNATPKNGQTVFEDTGFILLTEGRIRLHSAQIGGRIEVYDLTEATDTVFRFDMLDIVHDPKTIRSQRIITVAGDELHYQLNMATHDATFQNHLAATLKKTK